MSRRIQSWWRGRTERERLLLKSLGVLAFGILAPLWVLISSLSFRADAEAEFRAARELRELVGELSYDRKVEILPSDGSIRGVALAAAENLGLDVARVEPLQQDRVRIAFAPSNSVLIYRWIDMTLRNGVYVSRTSIVRVEVSEDVRAEFELAPSP